MNENKVVIDINSLNKLINDTIEALDEAIKKNRSVDNIIQVAVVVKELQQSINENGFKLAEIKRKGML